MSKTAAPSLYSSCTLKVMENIIQQAQQWIEEKKRQGWTREDFLCEMGKAMNVDQDLIADLHYITGYANIIRDDLLNGKKPLMGFVNRMAELAEKVQRALDPQFEEWCNNAEARR